MADDRSEFEAWASTEFNVPLKYFTRYGTGEYANPYLEGASKAWQARSAEVRELREALKKYGDHAFECNHYHGWNDKHCTCGFSELVGKS